MKYSSLLGDFCVQVIRTQFYGMIGRRRHLVVVYSPALIVDEPRSLDLRILPCGYGPVDTVDALVAAGEIGRQAGTAYLMKAVRSSGSVIDGLDFRVGPWVPSDL